MSSTPATSIRVAVRFFASLRELVDTADSTIEVPAGSTAAGVWEACAARWPALAPRRATTVLAVNREFARPGTPVHDGDEVALLPPVSGGTA